MNKTPSNHSGFSKFIQALIRPYKLCWLNISKTILWVIYILLGGLLGVVINLIDRWICGDMTFTQALYVESIGGTFYTFAIVLISASIGPLFFNMAESKKFHYPNIKAFTITICLFTMVFCAIFYSNLEDKVSEKIGIEDLNNFTVDWSQLVFFILAIIIALYVLGIEYLDKDTENNKDIDSSEEYREDEEYRVDKLEQANPTTAGRGLQI